MSDKIERYRGALAKINSRIAFALAHQGEDEAKNEVYLAEVLRGVVAEAEIAVNGIGGRA